MPLTPTYQSPCGTVTLYLADCLTVLPTLGKVDAVITDPPYGIGYVPRQSTGSLRTGRKAHNPAYGHAPVTGDAETPDVRHLLDAAAKVAIWGGNYFANQLPPSSAWLIWDKRGAATGAPWCRFTV